MLVAAFLHVRLSLNRAAGAHQPHVAHGPLRTLFATSIRYPPIIPEQEAVTMRITTFLAMLAITAILTVGCGKKGEFDTAPISGTVTFEGQPVTEGTIDFVPAPGTGTSTGGKPAAATVNADGTYSADTYGNGDGVVPGMKRVRYSAPLPADTREAAQAPPSKYIGMEIEPNEIEVSASGGEFNFELKKPSKKKR